MMFEAASLDWIHRFKPDIRSASVSSVSYIEQPHRNPRRPSIRISLAATSQLNLPPALW